MTQLTRRRMTMSLAAFALMACENGAVAQNASSAGLPPELRPVPNPDFDRWVQSFRGRAQSRGISTATLDRAFTGAGYLPVVVTRDRNQIQTRRSLDEYLSIATSDDRIAQGRAAMAKHATLFAQIESRYGVPQTIVAAIWGMESRYGARRGNIPVVSATATLAFDGRRGSFYEDQLVAALRVLERGDTTPDKLVGSWAGAMGHTQFIPTSYQAFAVDFDGDGRRDIWSDDPTDALASAAAYLQRNGWRSGLRWGAETGTAEISGRTIQPQAGGVRFTVTRNFNVIKTYNNSDFYALGIGLLADRLGGAGPLRGSFPPDANGMTRADRIALQRGLARQGFDIGTIDGVFGTQSEEAIRAYQASEGLPVTGQPSLDLMRRLQ